MIVIEYSSMGQWMLVLNGLKVPLESVNFVNQTQEVNDTEDPEIKHTVVISSSVTFQVPQHAVDIRKVD